MESDTPHLEIAAPFERAAEAARLTEEAYCREAARRIAELERERTNAFRRLNLMRGSIEALTAAEEPEQALARARFALTRSLGWDEIGPPQERVLDRLTPFLEALSRIVLPDADGRVTSEAEDTLRDVESWYTAEVGDDFHALFDRYMPETPRVDF